MPFRSCVYKGFHFDLTFTWRKGWRWKSKAPQATPRYCHCPFRSLGLSFPICKRDCADSCPVTEIPGEAREGQPPGRPRNPQPRPTTKGVSRGAGRTGAARKTLNARAPMGGPGGRKAAPTRRTEGSACGARSWASGRRRLLTGPRGRVLGRGSGWG